MFFRPVQQHAPERQAMALPTEINFIILRYLPGNEILRLRRFATDLPDWLHFLLSDRALYLALKQIQESSTSINSARPVLPAFEEITPQELKEREALWRQIPRSQEVIEIPLDRYNNAWTSLQGSKLVIPGKMQIYITDLIDKTNEVHDVPYALQGVVTDELIACHSGRNFYLWKSGVLIKRSFQSRVRHMAANNSKVAILENDYIQNTLWLYDIDEDKFDCKGPLESSMACLVWQEEPWILSVERKDDGFTLHANGRTHHSRFFAQKLDYMHGMKARSTGDGWQIIVEFTMGLYGTTRSFVFNDLGFESEISSQMGGGRSEEVIAKVWRNTKVETSLHGVRIGNAFLKTYKKPYILINDSFLVTISRKNGFVVCNVVTFDETIHLKHDIPNEPVDGMFYWEDSEQ